VTTNQSPLVTYFSADLASLLAPWGARLYINDAATAQSLSVPGNALRGAGFPSTCLRIPCLERVIAPAP
jgi:hypothetical protein